MQFYRWLVIPFLAVALWHCGAASSSEDSAAALELAENPDIHLTVEGFNGGLVRLIGMISDQQYVADTISAAGGDIVFQRDEPYEQGMYFVLLPNNANFQILITTDQTFTMTTSVQDLVGQMKVEGSEENTLLYENLRYEAAYQAKIRPLQQQLQGLTEGTPEHEQVKNQLQAHIDERKAHLEEVFEAHPQAFFTSFKQAGQNPDIREGLSDAERVYWYRREFWNDVDFNDERLLRTPVIANKLKRYITELTNQHPDSIIAATDYLIGLLPEKDSSEYFKFFANWVALQYEPTKTDLMDPEAVFAYMVQRYFTYDKAFWSDSTQVFALQQRAGEMAASVVGKDAPDVTVPGIDGQAKTLYDLKAPYLVVYLYNPDCEHCQEQTPVLVNLYRKWQSEPQPQVDVYAIAVDTDAAAWKDYVAKTGMNWTNVFDPTNRSIYRTYYVDVTPEVYVVGPDRKIIAKNLNVNQIEEVINRDRAKRN